MKKNRGVNMDFKIGDEIEESSGESKKNKNILPIIIIVVISLVCGLTVFLISNALFGEKEVKEDPIVEAPLSLTDENVEILYAYVTYGAGGVRNEKFIKEPKVTLESFTNQEKFYYALQFAQVEDFAATGKVNEDGKKIYNISDAKIRTYMQRFFGGNVTYNNAVTLTHPFSFKINGQNIGILTASTSGGLDTIFDGVEEPKPEELIKPYYAELVAAYKEVDGTYRLEEKIIFTRVEKKEDNTYTIYLYKDREQTQLIETKLNQTEEMLKESPISIKNYLEKASTIKYHFGIFNNMLYFDSSEMVSNVVIPQE